MLHWLSRLDKMRHCLWIFGKPPILMEGGNVVGGRFSHNKFSHSGGNWTDIRFQYSCLYFCLLSQDFPKWLNKFFFFSVSPLFFFGTKKKSDMNSEISIMDILILQRSGNYRNLCKKFNLASALWKYWEIWLGLPGNQLIVMASFSSTWSQLIEAFSRFEQY